MNRVSESSDELSNEMSKMLSLSTETSANINSNINEIHGIHKALTRIDHDVETMIALTQIQSRSD